MFVSYPIHKNLCVITYLLEYLKRTSSLLGQRKQLLTSFVKPHKPISNETVSHWIKNFMVTAGIDTNQHKSHSTRAGSTKTGTWNAGTWNAGTENPERWNRKHGTLER